MRDKIETNRNLLQAMDDFDKTFSEIRNRLADIPNDLMRGWRAMLQSTDSESWILHIQRALKNKDDVDITGDPKPLAIALKNIFGWEWHRYGSQWQCGGWVREGEKKPKDRPFFTIMIHGAQLDRPQPNAVEL
jgi:hypothetical protein